MKNKALVLTLLFLVISILNGSQVTTVEFESNYSIGIEDSQSVTAAYVPRDIRVAIYNETNFTAPAYATNPGSINNNVTGLMDILVGFGYDVTLLDVHDIYNYELTTVNYDVLCLVDNFPRENITSRVMDFWLGGGGLLVFDGSAGFLCSFGILPPEALGTDGSPPYWDYDGNDLSFSGLHPITRSYTLPTSISTGSGGFNWDFIALQGTSIAADLTNVATSHSSPNDASILAFDPSDRGGRVVTISHNLEWVQLPELYPLYNDAVDWLAPRPKARILYDLTHQPWCPTDTWEWNGDGNYLTSWRDGLVANSFTVDKLHPSSLGNLTPENLAPYDMLVTNQPLLNYTVQEVQAVEEWVQAGGGLFIVGDNPNVLDNHHLNFLINPYGIQFNHTVSSYSQAVAVFDMHPTTEGCTSLNYHGATSLILSGSAYPLWSYAPGEVAVGAVEYGEGRVVVICDANSVLDNWITELDNEQFAMNVANWLTTSSATVLLYHDSVGISPYNYYRSAVATALNELGINYMLTFDRHYFNLSLNLQEWDFVISDANGASPVPNYRFILEHLENGGKLIMRDFYFKHPNGTDGNDLALFTYIGFEGAGSQGIISGAPTVYIWDVYHDVFNRPVDFAVNHFESTANFYVTDFTNVTLYANATAIAGITPSPAENQSAIILGVDGRALCNMFSISQYFDDFDDSTYADNYELWLNEIAYMMSPTIDSPGDLSFDKNGGPSQFYWIAHSYAPADYQIKRDSVIITTHVWDGSPIPVDISGLSVGVYEYDLMVRDHIGYRTDDTITVTITDTTPTTTTTTTTTTTGTGIPIDTIMIIIIVAAGAVVIVIIIIIMKKRGT